MRALVTGASGSLGGRLTQMLAGSGAQVTVLAREGTDLAHLRGLPVRVVRGSLTEFAALREAVRGCTHVFHCASCEVDWLPERTYFNTHVLGTGMLLEAANREPRLQRFLHVSTTDVYGYPELPGDETAELVDSGIAYQRTRLQAELAVWGHADGGLPVTVIRPATIYGPGCRSSVVDLVRRLRQRRLVMVNGGRARGGFCYVDNVASALQSAAASERTVGQVYNLVDETGVSWRRYLAELAGELGLEEPRIDLPFRVAMAAARTVEALHPLTGSLSRPLLLRRTVYLLGRDREFRSTRARNDFGYSPGVGFAEGMRRTVAWVRYAEQRSWGETETQLVPVE